MGLIATSLRIAFRNLLANKVRSALTLLGMFIGVMAVISIVSLGEGIKAYFSQEISKIGSDRMFIVPEPPKREGVNTALIKARDFTLEQVKTLERTNTTLAEVEASPNFVSVTFKYGNNNFVGQIAGGSNRYLTLNNYIIAQGRNMTAGEARAHDKVIILGHKVAGELFPYENPIGKTVKLSTEGRSSSVVHADDFVAREQGFTVIGVLERKGASGGAPAIDNQAVIPTGTVMDRLTGNKDLYWIDLRVKPGVEVADAEAEVRAILRSVRRITDPTKDDFQVIFPSTFQEFGNTFINVLVAVFGVISAMSLLVGGIGVSNIMLVAVTERTREIGLRKALGAPPRAIMLQFLIEAVFLTLIGGLLGMAGGYFAAFGLVPILRTFLADGFTPSIPIAVSVGTLLVTAAIGIGFGVVPAIKASRLDPIEALRYE